MESKLIRKYGAWEYTSKSGLKYTIGEITAEFNVIIDDFEDVNELFDCDALVHSCLITYVYGNLNDERDREDMKGWIDAIIEAYEKHQRTVQFYNNIMGMNDENTLYECYIGTEEYKPDQVKKITKEEMIKMAESRH